MKTTSPAKLSLDATIVEEVSAIVSRITGVQLGPKQRVMVETRLKRRIAAIGLASERDYLPYLRQHAKEETDVLVSLLTTHHTFFFREYKHFEFLEEGALAAIVKAAAARRAAKIRIWSAACSRGQEVYSLAMFLAEQMPLIDPKMGFEILGTDVDSESVAIAKNGVFHHRELKQVPARYLQDYWAKGTGEIADFAKVKKVLRDHCSFQVVNLLDERAIRNLGSFDVIFCRNVFIYFTSEQIVLISKQLLASLQPEGALIIGLSESLNNLSLNVTSDGPSVYRHRQEAAAARPIKKSSLSLVVPSRPKILRVVCVDDSPSVIALLKQILGSDKGFEVVGTAANGVEAHEVITRLKPDVVTLDIHMPQQTGLEYLQRRWTPSHPPVIMVSSVAREDAELALQCLRAGASDYVEKPALSNMMERGDELRMKLSSSAKKAETLKSVVPSSKLPHLDVQFAAQANQRPRPGSRRLLIAGLGDLRTIGTILSELRDDRAPLYILTEGIAAVLPAMVQSLKAFSSKSMSILDETGQGAVGENEIGLGDLKAHWAHFQAVGRASDTSVFVFGMLTAARAAQLSALRGAQILLEDLRYDAASPLPEWASDVSPATSFVYLSKKFLS